MPGWEDTTDVTELHQAEGDSEDKFERNRPCLVVLSGLHIGQTFVLHPSKPHIVGRSRKTDVRLVDDGVSRQHISINWAQDGDPWIEDLGSRNGTFCNGKRISRQRLQDGDKIQLGRSTMLRFTHLDEHDESFQRLMYDSALRDGLTRTFNKRYFTERLQAEFRFAKRHQTRLTLLLLDIDHFKRVNDTHGHVAGDFVLTEFVDAIQECVRTEDVFARFGGEEFALMTRALSSDHAAQFGERLRAIIESLHIEYEDKTVPLTMSVGISCYPDLPAERHEDLLEAADLALYEAKNAGRNCIRLYDDEMELNDDGQPVRTLVTVVD